MYLIIILYILENINYQLNTLAILLISILLVFIIFVVLLYNTRLIREEGFLYYYSTTTI